MKKFINLETVYSMILNPVYITVFIIVFLVSFTFFTVGDIKSTVKEIKIVSEEEKKEIVSLDEIEKGYSLQIHEKDDVLIHIYPRETKKIKGKCISIYASFLSSETQIFYNIVNDCENNRIIVLAAKKYNKEGYYEGRFDDREFIEDYIKDNRWISLAERKNTVAGVIHSYVCR